MSKFKEYLEAKTTKTKGTGISENDKKILEGLSGKNSSLKDYKKEGRLPNTVQDDRSRLKNLPDIGIAFKDKNYPPKYETQKFEDISFSSGHLSSKKDIKELISILNQLLDLDCIE